MVNRKQKCIVDKQKKKAKESKHITKRKSTNHKGREQDKEKQSNCKRAKKELTKCH